MKTTMTISQNLNCSPFEVFDQDVDEVIMLINFYIALGNESPETMTQSTPGKKSQERIRVNDATATGGWF